MPVEPDSEPPPQWQVVHFHEYPESFDLTSKDLISLLDRPKEDVFRLVGNMTEKSEMEMKELPGNYVTCMDGDAADEIHEWPKATLGSNFRHLILKFGRGRLIELSWKFTPLSPRPARPWWKLW